METGPDGRLHLRENPPLLTHVDITDEEALTHSFREYLTSVPADVAVVLSHFQVTDIALRWWESAASAPGATFSSSPGRAGHPSSSRSRKPTGRSSRVRRSNPTHDADGGRGGTGPGIRVVDGQRILQAISDVFLGTLRIAGRDFYVRQYQDMKGSVETEGLDPEAYGQYVGACGYSLARATPRARTRRCCAATSAAATRWRRRSSNGRTPMPRRLADFDRLKAAAKAGEIEVAPDPLR